MSLSSALNNRFYAEHAASFSATRIAPWAGWSNLAESLREHGWGIPRGRRSVLDLACGNLCFARFLADAFPETNLRFEAIDSCPALADAAAAPPSRSEASTSWLRCWMARGQSS